MFATYFIPDDNVPKLIKKLEDLVKRAAKLGALAITFEVAKTFAIPHPNKERREEGELFPLTAITIQGEAPTLNGWAFVGTLDHEILPDGKEVNILRCHGEEALPERFRTAGPENCDHCGTRRFRKNTFIVRHEDGTFKQVGRQCLKDFLGYHKDPGALATYATILLNFEDFLADPENEGGWGGGGEYAFALRKFLAYTAVAIDDDGWTSRTQAKERETMATADRVWAFYTARTPEARRAWHLPDPTEKHFEEADGALAWMAGEDATTNDYVHNCQVIIEMGFVKWKHGGYAASILSGYRRHLGRKLKKEYLKANGTDYIGTEGKRGDFCLTLLGRFACEGFYGTTYIHRFADPDGNPVVWFASNPEVVPEGAGHEDTNYRDKAEMVIGATYRVKATVKAHDTYKDEPQTKVTRLAVQPLTKPKKKRKARKAKPKAPKAKKAALPPPPAPPIAPPTPPEPPKPIEVNEAGQAQLPF